MTLHPQNEKRTGQVPVSFLFSMRFNIPLGIILIIAFILTVVGNIAIQEQRERMLAQVRTYGQEATDFIARIAVVPIQKYSFFQIEDYVNHLEKGAVIAYCLVHDTEGHVLAGNTSRKAASSPDADLALFSAPVTADSKLIGRVEIGIDLGPVTDKIRKASIFITLLLAFQLLMIGIVVSIFIHSRLVAPIMRLSQITTEIADGRFSLSDLSRRQDEVGWLAGSINTMSRNLSELYHKLENMVTERTADLLAAKTDAELVNKNLAILTAEQQAILDNSPVGIIFVTPERIIQRVNHEFSNITGYTSEELIGKSTRLLYADEQTWEEARQITTRQLQSEGIWQDTVELVQKNGTPMTCSIRGRLTLIGQSESGIIWSVEDITDKIRMESELLRISKLESFGVLVEGIAHDFNNILMAVIGNISLAEQFVERESKASTLLSSARTSSIEAKELTGKLLSFARGNPPASAAVQIQDLISDSADFILAGSYTTCHYDFEKGLWPVHIGPDQMIQIIQNLVLNSSQAMGSRGEVQILCKNTIVSDTQRVQLQKGNYVQVTVIDSGRGIAENHLNKIFDPYFSTQPKDSNRGSGLGLSIVHSIVNRHKGSITVQSTLGQGTTFEILLPANAAANTGETAKILPTGKGRILIIDHKEEQHENLKEMLSFIGYETIQAFDANQAFDIVKNDQNRMKNIRAVILDASIAGDMNVIHPIKMMKEFNNKIKVFVLTLTPDDTEHQIQKLKEFDSILVKPLRLPELSRLISEVLR